MIIDRGRIVAIATAALFGCAAEQTPEDGAEAGAGPYRYVLGFDPERGERLTGGAHDVITFLDRGQDAIDEPNRPGRLHPDLIGDDYMRYDATRREGQADGNVFASNWWPQSRNGIAERWTGGSGDYAELGDGDRLSPAEKYDLLFNPGQAREVAAVEHWNYADLNRPEGERGQKHSHPRTTVAGPATAWELQQHGTYQTYAHPDSWWGHCNGWASYATVEPGGAPVRDVRVRVAGGKVTECAEGAAGCVLVRLGDIEALMSEVYFSDQATFAGRRCEREPSAMERDEFGRPTDSACRDTNPGAFHVAIAGLLGKGARDLTTQAPARLAFVIDHNYDWQVWNFPLVKYSIDEEEEVDEARAQQLVGASGSDYQFNAQATRFVRIRMTYWMISDGVSASEMGRPASERSISPQATDLNYVLELDRDGKILGGEWIAQPGINVDSRRLHPDFMWMAVQHRGWGEDADDLGGSDDNPFIAYSKVRALLDCANDAATCAEGPGTDTGTGTGTDTGTGTGTDTGAGTGVCAGRCGEQIGDCWCDDQCTNYGDCCEGLCQACGFGC